MNSLTWRQRTACLGADPDLFYPARGDPGREAKEICARCPVREECLEYALANREQFGIWGGLGESARARLRRGLPGRGLLRSCALPGCDGTAVGRNRYCSPECAGKARLVQKRESHVRRVGNMRRTA